MDDRYENQRWFLWTPVGLALGSAFYFLLTYEPSFRLLVLLNAAVGSFLALVWYGAHTYVRRVDVQQVSYDLAIWSVFVCRFGLAVLIGFSAGKMRTEGMHVPVFPQQCEKIAISAFVESVEDVPRGTIAHPRTVRRLVISQIRGLPFAIASDLKARVQAPYSKLQSVEPFQRVELITDLGPPQYPLTAHGYDAPFDLYFKGISALGKVWELRSVHPAHARTTTLKQRIQKLRTHITQQIHARIQPEYAPIACSLITGDKSGIGLRTRENFTRAGISHMLAISGLHMGLIAGLIFMFFSRFLVLIPGLALRVSIRKIAACITIPAAFGYLLLSGCSFSALRSFFMISLAMCAVMFDRSPISLRCTAIAAAVILLWYPESIFSISFQLSFASVTGLCYFAETQRHWRQQHPGKTSLFWLDTSAYQWWIGRCAIRCVNTLFQSVLVTLVATLATLPIIIYSFQRLTLVGVLGNLCAIPVLSFFVLPVGVLAALSLCKTGGVAVLFMLWEKGLAVLNWIAQTVASLPGADLLCPKPTLNSVVCIVLAALWLLIWRGKKRLYALPILLYGVYAFVTPTLPDLFVTQQGDIIGVADYTHQRFLISNPRLGSFHAKVWSQEVGLSTVVTMPYKEVDQWREIRFPRNMHPDDVIMGYQDTKKDTKTAAFHYSTLCFHNKKRPWYIR